MTDDPQGFLPPQPKPEPKKKAAQKKPVRGIALKKVGNPTGTVTILGNVIAAERIFEGSFVYIGDDGKAYNYLPPDA